MLDNKNRGQIGETMTWVIATIVIIAILIISIYAASLLAQTRKKFSFKADQREEDLIMEKSLFAYFLVDDAKKSIIYNKLNQEEFYADLDDKITEIREVIG